MKTTSLFLFFQLWFYLCSVGQPTYNFSTATQSYQDLENPTILNDSSFPEGYNEFMIESDFLISYFDENIYSILVTNRGRIYFGSQSQYVELLPVRLKLGNDSQISYQKEGESGCGNRILKIEYKNIGFKCDTTDSHFANVQLWIYENTGVLEIHFGESFDNPEIYETRDPDCYGRTYYGSRLRYNQDLSALPYGDPASPKFYQGDLGGSNIDGLASIPPNGMVYRFDIAFFLNNSFKMSPNPARDNIRVFRPKDCGDFVISIYNITGALIFQSDFRENEKTIDVSNLLIGVYFVQIYNEKNNKTFVEKLLIL